MKDEQIYDLQGLGNSSDKVNLSNVSVAGMGSICRFATSGRSVIFGVSA